MSWDIAILLACALSVALVVTRIIKRPRNTDESPKSVTVHLTPDGFNVVVKGREEASVRWIDVQSVTVITTNQGPWKGDLFYHTVYTGGHLTLPSEAEGMVDWIDELTAVPGFDPDRYAQAISSTRNNSFIVVLTAL